MLVPFLEVGNTVSIFYERRGEQESPKISRIRTDVTWDDVITNFHKERMYMNGMKRIEGEEEGKKRRKKSWKKGRRRKRRGRRGEEEGKKRYQQRDRTRR